MKRLTTADLDRWQPQMLAVCMAFDAFRMALGGPTQTFHPADVIGWLRTCRNVALDDEDCLRVHIKGKPQ